MPTERQLRQQMMEADRRRARIAYAGLNDNQTDRQQERVIARNRRTPEYIEADAEFRRLSGLLDNGGPEALKRLFRI